VFSAHADPIASELSSFGETTVETLLASKVWRVLVLMTSISSSLVKRSPLARREGDFSCSTRAALHVPQSWSLFMTQNPLWQEHMDSVPVGAPYLPSMR